MADRSPHPLAFVLAATLLAPSAGGAQQRSDTPLPPRIGLRFDATTRLAEHDAVENALSGAIGVPTRAGEAWLGWQRSTVDRWTIGLTRHFGALAIGITGGSSRGTVRGGTRSVQHTVVDTIQTDTGWVVVERPDGAPQTVTGKRGAQWTTGELRATWSAPRLTAGITFGGRPSTRHLGAARWGAVELSTRLLPDVWLVGGAMTGPGAADARDRAPRSASLGLRLSGALLRGRAVPVVDVALPVPVRFTVARVASGVYRIVLHAPDAHRVELSADFTQWTPLVLAPTLGGLWVADVRVAPGAYRVDVRVDGGEWAPPPGSVAVDDGFGGRAGIVVIPEQ